MKQSILPYKQSFTRFDPIYVFNAHSRYYFKQFVVQFIPDRKQFIYAIINSNIAICSETAF